VQVLAAPVGNVEMVTLDVDGLAREYLLYVPPALADSDEPVALLVDIHGFGSDPDGHDAISQMRALADAAGFVVAQPFARGAIPTWNGQPDEAGSAVDIAFMRSLVTDVASRISIDPGAVFASGFSNGGGMVHRLACDAPDVFAAVGTVSGQYPLVEACDPELPVAIIALHGTTDLIVPLAGVEGLFPEVTSWAQRWAARNGCAPVPARTRLAVDVLLDTWTSCRGDVEVKFFTIEEGPHAWPGSPTTGFFPATTSISASQEMWRFFMEHARR
jgi:polyhydroxybutyrate depolymerase